MKICKIATKGNQWMEWIHVQLYYWLVTIGVNRLVRCCNL